MIHSRATIILAKTVFTYALQAAHKAQPRDPRTCACKGATSDSGGGVGEHVDTYIYPSITQAAQKAQPSVPKTRASKGAANSIDGGDGLAEADGAPPTPEEAAREFKAMPPFLAGGNLHDYQLNGLNW